MERAIARPQIGTDGHRLLAPGRSVADVRGPPEPAVSREDAVLDSITFVGNLCKEPELRETPSGDAVVSLRLANTARRFDRARGEWVDGSTTFLDVSAWGALARNVAASLHTGHRVVVAGQLRERRYEHKDGGIRVAYDVRADVVAADLTHHSALLTKVRRDRLGPDRDDLISEAAGAPSDGTSGHEAVTWPTEGELALLDAARQEAVEGPAVAPEEGYDGRAPSDVTALEPA